VFKHSHVVSTQSMTNQQQAAVTFIVFFSFIFFIFLFFKICAFLGILWSSA